MQTIVYTASHEIDNEIDIISELFEIGVDYLHIRKPELDDFSLVDFVEKIPEKYWKKCISTSMIITKEFDLGGYHFTRDILYKNELYNEKILSWLHASNKISSVSAHTELALHKYGGKFRHIIVSPLFKSISKENYSYNWNMEELKNTLSSLQTKAKYFAVGGIEINKLESVKALDFNGVGLLGAIWNNPESAVNTVHQIINKLK